MVSYLQMKPPATPLGPRLQSFFVEYFWTQTRASPPTLASDRDPLHLLREFLRDTYGIEPATAGIADVDVPVLLAFLDPLEHARHHAIRSCHRRLAAIRSFCRLVARRDPASVHHAARVLAISVTRADRQGVTARSRAEIDAMLAVLELQHGSGRRDHVRLLTWDNRGARVSALTTLEPSQCLPAWKSRVSGRRMTYWRFWPRGDDAL